MQVFDSSTVHAGLWGGHAAPVLICLYHKMLEEIEKRTDINIFVDDSVTQYNIRSTTIKDSIVQRSNIETGIDTGGRTCPNCGSPVEEEGKFCMECGEKLINS